MNRSHNATMAIHAVDLANKCGIDNISIDLIYGLPDLSPADWQANLKTAEQLPITHISCYALTIEERTALSHFVKTKKISIPTDEIVITQFKELVDWAIKNHFDHYEISNFCKAGFHSRHNSNYWSGQNYIGIGPSAHSYNGNSRQWNIANNTTYIDCVTNSKSYFDKETLTQENKYNEYVMIHLRTKAGVDVLQLQNQFGKEYTSHFEKKIAAFVTQKQVVVMQNNYVLTMEGKLFADAIAGDCFVEV
jgi:oxygen-independent coproporphyrinogen-3 oxidase